MLNSAGHAEEKIYKALEMPYVDRENEFRELSQMCLGEKNTDRVSNSKEFILNFCLDVSGSFNTCTGQKLPSVTSPPKL